MVAAEERPHKGDTDFVGFRSFGQFKNNETNRLAFSLLNSAGVTADLRGSENLPKSPKEPERPFGPAIAGAVAVWI